jgi:hypothetical protein
LGVIKVVLSGACSGWVWDKSHENQPKAMTTERRHADLAYPAEEKARLDRLRRNPFYQIFRFLKRLSKPDD